jgi:hypothetical protein
VTSCTKYGSRTPNWEVKRLVALSPSPIWDVPPISRLFYFQSCFPVPQLVRRRL